MKILLTHAYFIASDPAELQVMKPYPPLGILYLSAWLKKEGIQVDIYDPTFQDLDEMKKHLALLKPEMIGIYSTLMTRHNVLNLIRFIRGNEESDPVRIIIGGPDARYYADLYLNNGADIVIPGEAEQTLTETVKSLGKQGVAKLSIKGIVYMDDQGTIINTVERELLEMDELPLPDRESIDINCYLDTWKKNHSQSSITVNTMRGCPYSCNWCSKSIFGNTYRRRSPDLVIDELQMIRERYNPGQIWFTDDVFTINKKWLKQLCDELAARKFYIKYECISRADCLDDEIIEMLKMSGCRKLWIGAESGSQKVIDLMNRRINVQETIIRLNKAKEAGISTGIFIMPGYKGEELEDILRTAQFLKKTKPDEITIGMAYPIKGTKFFTEVEDLFKQLYNGEMQNERQIMFRNRNSDRFYFFAVRYLYNSYSAAKSNFGLNKILFLVKALFSGIGLRFINLPIMNRKLKQNVDVE